MSLDLTIHGDIQGIKDVSEWLSGTLASAATDADVELANLVLNAQYWWLGEAGRAFNSTAQAARRATFCVPNFVRDLAEVMRAYADRLQRGQDYFDEVRAYATNGGLLATSSAVLAPEPEILYCPGPEAPREDHDKYDEYVRKLELYNQLGEDVGTWEGQLETWVIEQFGALLDRLEEIAEAASVLETLVEHNQEFVTAVLTYAKVRTNRSLDVWSTRATERFDAYEEYKANKRSGHPARRAAAEKAIPSELRASRAAAFDQMSKYSRASRIIPGIGHVVDAGYGAYRLSQGESPSSFAIEMVAGAGGAAAAGALTAGGPVVWVAGAVVVGSVAAGTGAKWLWESAVPLHMRESLDNHVRTNASRNWIFWDDSPRIPQ